MKLSLELTSAVTVSVDLKPDLLQTRKLWAKRLKKLGSFSAGPTKWMDLDLTNPEVVKELEDEERILSSAILEVVGQNPGIILVVGFGPAADLNELLTRSNGECFGVDCTPDMVRFTQQKIAHPEQFVDGLASCLAFQNDRFDLVIWKRLGNHLVDDREWETALEEVVRVMKPGGVFLLCESFLGDNLERVMSPGSKFRMLEAYDRTLTALVRLTGRERMLSFAGDRYRIELYLKELTR